MRYDEYLAAGLPNCQWGAEGACKHLVKDRMERAGMRWELEGAQATLALRAVYLNGLWDQFIAYALRQNRRVYMTKIRSMQRLHKSGMRVAAVADHVTPMVHVDLFDLQGRGIFADFTWSMHDVVTAPRDKTSSRISFTCRSRAPRI